MDGVMAARRLKAPAADVDHAGVTDLPAPSARRRRASALAVPLGAVLVAGLLLAGSAPGSAATGEPSVTPVASPSPSAGSNSSPDEDTVRPPSKADLQAQRDYLAQLKDDVGRHSDALVKAQADQAATAAAAAVALERYTEAERALNEATTRENAERERLLQVQLDLERQRAALGRWARAAYQEGQVGADYGTLLTILSAEPTDDVSNLAASMSRIGRSRGRTVERYVQARQDQAALTASATEASATALAAADAAAGAKATRDAALREQQQAVLALQEQLGAVRGREQAARKQLDVMQQAADRAADYLARRGTSGDVGDCKGGDVSRYPNGKIPVSELCPLWGAPGHHLRADAAFGFNQLSKAYAEAFGSPICVTDSYRTYDEQVDLRRRKPNLAARPGTSNHGWGTATDLCGGIQSFSTAQHRWMVLNGPAFGWFHPSWARQGGSKPEPWHFEYGG